MLSRAGHSLAELVFDPEAAYSQDGLERFFPVWVLRIPSLMELFFFQEKGF